MAHVPGGALCGQAVVGLSDKTVDAWAGEITNKWRTLIAQQQKASGAARQGTDPLQSPRGKADPRGVGEEGTLAPSATVGRSACFLLACAHCNISFVDPLCSLSDVTLPFNARKLETKEVCLLKSVCHSVALSVSQ